MEAPILFFIIPDVFVEALNILYSFAHRRLDCVVKRGVLDDASFMSLQPHDTLQLVRQYKALKTAGDHL